MQKLVQEEPGIMVEEALAEALRTENEREIVRGFSPTQHALGRTPNELGRFSAGDIQGIPEVLVENPQGEFQRNQERMMNAEKAIFEYIYNDRIRRAQNTRSYGIQQFAPGDLVYVWRIQTKGPASSAKTGGFTGPCRVLAMETRMTDEGTY